MKFYNQVLLRSFEITQSLPSELKVLVSTKFEFPSLGSDQHGKVLCVPKPVKKKNGFVLNNVVFANNEVGRTLLMKTLMAAVEHLSVHAIISDFSLYAAWLNGKDPKIAVFVMDIIEDLCVKIYARSRLKGLLRNMAIADAVSYVVMNQTEVINSKQFLLQSALLSFLIAGRYKFLLPPPIKKDVMTILALLHNFEKTVLQRTEQSANFWWVDDEIKNMKIKLANAIYECISKYGSPKETVYRPYTDAHDRLEGGRDELTLQMEHAVDIAVDTLKALGLQLTSEKSVQAILGKSSLEEASNLFHDLDMEERWKNKLIDNYTKLAKNTEFDGLIFPEEDFAEYARSYAKYAGSIRRIIEQIRMRKNMLDPNPNQELGQVDIQEAIQAIASQKMTNIFVREDFLKKDEAWGILLDMSTSIKPFSITSRDMALCLSEIAKEIITEKHSWGLYAFSNKFAVVKDISEDYSQNVKARIGGLGQGGLSYIPDALQLTAQIVASAGKEYNYLFVISDGLPCGYANIEARLDKTVKEVMRRGMTIFSIGLGSNALQKYTRGTSLRVDSIYELMAKFTKMYLSLAVN